MGTRIMKRCIVLLVGIIIMEQVCNITMKLVPC